ncbi:MAG TPA: thiamine pyrophosphate-binding protein [Egibacteraceae bacterium]|nr:thiamine pyrophosphate-binding protein [Egibacteraceae bacterium]
MPRYEGGNLLVEALAQKGVTRLFSVSGGPINSVYVAARAAGVQLCHVRHETAAAFMADATARVTGVPGVAVVTLGPGVTNTVTGAATAQLAGVPMLIVGGQAPLHAQHKGAGMSMETVPIMERVTNWAAQVVDTARIPEYVEAAWRHMFTGRPGPVYLEIPVDVLSAETDRPPDAPGERLRHPAGVVPAAMEQLEELLTAARRPVLIAGDDVRWSDAGALLRSFVDAQRIPFAQARLARGAVPEQDHPLFMGPGYLPNNAVLRHAVGTADLVILLGHFFDFDLGFGEGLSPDTTVVQVHPDPTVLGRNVVPHLGIASSSAALLERALDIQPAARDEEWVGTLPREWREQRATLSTKGADHSDGIHPLALVDAVVDAMPSETTYVTSHGNIDFWADAHIEVDDPSRYLRAGQAGALGAEIPYGVAAKLARPDDPVVVFVGDGGVGYHVMELETAARYGAPVIVVVADDRKWGAIAIPQRQAYGMEVEMDLPPRDWARLATAIGGHGETVDDLAEIPSALERAVKSKLPAIVHVRVASVLSPYMASIS